MEQLKRLPMWGTYVLLAYMPFHIFLSQWLSTITGGLSVWKVWKDVLTISLVMLSIALVILTRTYRKTPYLLFVGLSVIYTLLHVALYFLNKDTSPGIATLATVYNSRLLWYLIIGMSAALLIPKQLDYRKGIKIVLIASTIVACFGLLQYLLPKDLMTHFGYSLERGVRPAFFIDDKPDLPRIMSTIRDPNSLGAFLMLPITLLWAYLLTNKDKNRSQLLAGLLGVHLLALFLTFSRGAAAGTVISLLAVTVYLKKDLLLSLFKKFWPLLTVAVVVLSFGVFQLRDQYIIQNVIFHSDENTVSELDSNDLHLELIEQGVEGIQEKPVGHGPGTAGIVSIQNENRSYLTENYYVQIAHEVGIVGLILFLALLLMVFRHLYRQDPSVLEITLMATAIAYALLALLMHLWTNEVVAAQWWLLAGYCLGGSLVNRMQKDHEQAIIAGRKRTKRGI